MSRLFNPSRGVRMTLGSGPEAVRDTAPAETELTGLAAEEHSVLRAHGRQLAFSLLAVLVTFGFLLAALNWSSTESAVQQQEINQAVARALASITPAPPAAVTAYQAVRPTLVEVMAQLQDENGDDVISYGTGFIFNDSGTILTSLHVVQGSNQIQVTFADGHSSQAVVLKRIQDHDLAFLQPLDPPQQITPATLGNPHELQIGDQAIVVGNPMRLPGSLTTGSISGLDRVFMPPGNRPPIKGMIQIDAAVNPGNSGGPLLNRKGEVVGVITGRANPTGTDPFIGIGFAVPIDIAMSAGGPTPY